MLSQLSQTWLPETVLLATGPVRNLPRGSEIYAEGNSADVLLKVLSGLVRTCKFKRDGRRQIDAFYTRGDVFGFEAGGLYSLSAEAVSDCTLVSYRRRDVAMLATKHQGFADQLYTYSLRSLVRSQEHARILGHTSAAEKLAAFLIECSERSLQKDSILLGMSRIDIADYLGLTEETVSRGLTQLRLDSFIELVSARHIRILNVSRLRELYA
jgi:CRP/FNR family transcriptional regulator, nitrogen fixation regulation protein